MSSTVFLEVPQFALFKVFESNSIEEGMAREAPGGARVELGRMPMGKRWGGLTHDALPMAAVLLSFGRDVAVGLFAAWLYDKLKSDKAGKQMGVTKIRINRQEVEITPEAITRVITESIEIGEKK
jgi:hypothetical protein